MSDLTYTAKRIHATVSEKGELSAVTLGKLLNIAPGRLMITVRRYPETFTTRTEHQPMGRPRTVVGLKS